MDLVKLLCCSISLFLVSYISSALAVPEIGIGSMYDVLRPEERSIAKRIYNTGSSTAFVRVTLLEIDPDNNQSAKELPQKEIIDSKLEQNRLIVTPLRLIIPPSGFQLVRILWPGERNKERYYRIRFSPVMPDRHDNFGLDNKAASEYRKNALQAGLNVLTGYGTVLIVQPDKPIFNSVISYSHPDVISVKNKGNATISLDNIRQCKSVNMDCGSVTREFILPGRSRNIEKKSGYKTNFTLIEGSNKKVLTY